jgi:hypothetical protein
MATPVRPSEHVPEESRQEVALNRVTQALGTATAEPSTEIRLLANKIRDEALHVSRERTPEMRKTAQIESLVRRPEFLRAFKAGLAVAVGKTIGAADPRVLSVYSYDLHDKVMHLLVLVLEPTEGLSTYIQSLDQALTASIDELRIPDCFECVSIIDAQTITPKEVRLGVGPAAILSSVANAPLRVWRREAAAEETGPIVWHLSEVAESVRQDAVKMARPFVAEAEALTQVEALIRRPDFIGPFKCALAACVARVLGANDTRIRAVYSYDLTDPVIHLLVLVTQPTAALTAFVAALDRAVTTELRGMHLPEFAQCDAILDVSPITAKDVRLGIGPAALLSSVRSAPIRIWAR